MNKKKELKTLINKPWFHRMRGGTQLKLMKEGAEKEAARFTLGRAEVKLKSNTKAGSKGGPHVRKP